MNQWPNPFIEQRADPFYFYVTVATTISLLQCPNTIVWRSAGRTRWKGYAPPSRFVVWRKPEKRPHEPVDLGT